MASLADIPDPLLDPIKGEDFVKWISELPLELGPRRELAAIWRRFTKSPLSVDQYLRIERTSPQIANA